MRNINEADFLYCNIARNQAQDPEIFAPYTSRYTFLVFQKLTVGSVNSFLDQFHSPESNPDLLVVMITTPRCHGNPEIIQLLLTVLVWHPRSYKRGALNEKNILLVYCITNNMKGV